MMGRVRAALFSSFLAGCSPTTLEAPQTPVAPVAPVAAPVVAAVTAAGPSGQPPSPPAVAIVPAPVPPVAPPPSLVAPPPARRRPDGIRYGIAAGFGVGAARVDPAPRSTTGVAALGTLWVGLSTSDLLVVALRVDVGGVLSAALGDLGVHVALFPAGDHPGPMGDLQMFVDACLGGPIAQGSAPGTSTSTSITGLGRIGVAWERWRVATVALGPFLAGQMARGGEAQEAVLGGISASFTMERRKGP
jgi:hypothetical protein